MTTIASTTGLMLFEPAEHIVRLRCKTVFYQTSTRVKSDTRSVCIVVCRHHPISGPIGRRADREVMLFVSKWFSRVLTQMIDIQLAKEDIAKSPVRETSSCRRQHILLRDVCEREEERRASQ